MLKHLRAGSPEKRFWSWNLSGTKPDNFGQVEMKKPTRFSNKTSTARSCAEDRILENKILGSGF